MLLNWDYFWKEIEKYPPCSRSDLMMVMSLERFSHFIFLHSWWKSNHT